MLTATFIINEPDRATREAQARDSLVSIGRALDNTICLADDSNVSRYHAAIERRRDGFYLTDLGSSNGTTVGGEPVYGERRLRDGDRIAFGGTSSVEFYEHDAQETHAAAPPQQNFSSSASSTPSQPNYTPEKYRSPGQSQTPSSSSSPHGDQLGYYAGGALVTGAAAGVHSSSSTSSAHSASSHAAPAYNDFGTGAGDGASYDSYTQPHTEADAPPAHTSPATNAPMSPKTIAVGAAGGLALTACVALVLSGALTGGAACRGTARIVSPQTGTTLRAAGVLRVESENNQCIRRLRFQINGREFATSTTSPFDVPLDPSTLPRTGGNNVLTVVVESKDGEQELQDGEVVVALAPDAASSSTGATANATPPAQIDVPEPASNITTGALTTPDIQAMSQRFASQISHKSGYVFAPEFADLIRQRTPEYARAGGTAGARRHRREVIKAFRDSGLDPLLGFTLAFSQSKFAAETAGGGLWRVPPTVAANFLAPNETASALADPRRSAEVAAAYTKSLINTLETDDFTYAIACFGLSIDDAGEMRTKLAAADPVERRDFWKMVKSGVVPADQVDRVVRFYAAGIVAENPATFGATAEQPFSSLY